MPTKLQMLETNYVHLKKQFMKNTSINQTVFTMFFTIKFLKHAWKNSHTKKLNDITSITIAYYIHVPIVKVSAIVFNATFNNISVISWWSI